MKTFIFIIIFICVIFSNHIFAQQALEGIDAQNNLNALGANYNPTANNTVRVFDGRYKGFKGTACVFGKWYPTDIYFKNGSKYENQPCKFDIYKEQDLVVLRKAKRDSIILQNESISRFDIYDEDAEKKHIFKKFTLENNGSNVFCEVLHEGKYALILYREKTLLAAEFKGGYSVERFYDEFLMSSDYYLITPEKQIVKLKKSEKALLKILSNHPEKMKNYLKEHELDFKNEETIGKAVAYYEGL